ncbi:MAG: SGNH/GDSL hydrolase family protein [Eubacterium sp.]|nr:SGNH/GDSL hydrolase family protein [Eubacterium sp.]
MQDSNKENKAPEIDAKEIPDKNTSPKKLKAGGWLEIAGFLIIFMIALKIISYISDPVRLQKPELANPRERHISAALLEEANSMDLIIVGDSEAMVMASPEQMMEQAGISAYNFNQLGQRMSETYFFLQELTQKQSPQVMILETNVFTQETTLKKEADVTLHNILLDRFTFLRYHGRWKELWGLKEPEEFHSHKGFEPVEVIDSYDGSPYMFETDEVYHINPITIYYLDKVVELCKEKGISVFLVSSPSSIHMNYPKHNAIQAYADKQGLDYIDFNLMLDELGIDWSQDTGDAGDHINKYGAEKTTNYLIEYLNENYDLPDHRND